MYTLSHTHTHRCTLSSDQGTCTVILTSVLYLTAVRLHGFCGTAVEVSGGFLETMRSQTVTPQRLGRRAGKTVGERCSAAQTDSLGGSHSFAGISIDLCCLHGDTTQDKQPPARLGAISSSSAQMKSYILLFFLMHFLLCKSLLVMQVFHT